MAEIILSEVVTRRNGGESVNIVAGGEFVSPGAADLLIKFQTSQISSPSISFSRDAGSPDTDNTPTFNGVTTNSTIGMAWTFRIMQGVTQIQPFSGTLTAANETITLTATALANGSYTSLQSINGAAETAGPSFTIAAGGSQNLVAPDVYLSTPLIGNIPIVDIAPDEATFIPGTTGLHIQVATNSGFTTNFQERTSTPTPTQWAQFQTGLAAFNAFPAATVYTVHYRGRVTEPDGDFSAWVGGSYLQDNLPAIQAVLTTAATEFRPSFTVSPASGVTNALAVAGQTLKITLTHTLTSAQKILNATLIAGDITGGGTGFGKTMAVPGGDPPLASGAWTGIVQRDDGTVYEIAPFYLTTGANLIAAYGVAGDYAGLSTVPFHFPAVNNPSAGRILIGSICFNLIGNSTIAVSDPQYSTDSTNGINGTWTNITPAWEYEVANRLRSVFRLPMAAGTNFWFRATTFVNGSPQQPFSASMALIEATNVADVTAANVTHAVSGSSSTTQQVGVSPPAGSFLIAHQMKQLSGGATSVVTSTQGTVSEFFDGAENSVCATITGATGATTVTFTSSAAGTDAYAALIAVNGA